jgi:hypothetical protein
MIGDALRATRASRWRQQLLPAVPVLLLILLPVLVKLPLILGIMHANPMFLFSGLQHGMGSSLLATSFPPLPVIDPNIAFTSDALGHRAALDVVAGHMPWWNPFEGMGNPLAGEMNSAALFPPTLLLALRNGQLYEHISLQIIAGLSSFFLLRQLEVRQVPAFAGAAVFAFNGVFAWLGHSVINPVPFLPLLLLGIERAACRAQQGRRGGGAWITIGLALSLYAGFPEVAYLDGLLAGSWVLTRVAVLTGRARRAFLIKVALAGIAGLLIAAPILIAFGDYLLVADVGGHIANFFLSVHLDPGNLALVALPYLYGPIFFAPEHSEFWSNVGGYSGCALLAVATSGLLGRRLRPLRVLLAAWIVVALGLTFGMPWLHWIPQVIPGLGNVALYRYLPASWIMCLCVLAGFALDDMIDLGHGRRLAYVVPLLSGLLVAAMLVPGVIHPAFLTDGLSRWTLAMAAGCLVLLLIISARRRFPAAHRSVAAAVVLVGEAMVLFVLPTFFSPRGGSIQVEGVHFLQRHLGLQRFATLGPIEPNYGSYYGIAEINHNDIPVPRAWAVYLHDHLDRNAMTIAFDGVDRVDPNGPSAADALLKNLAAYAAVGVRYVVATPGQNLPGLREVYHDDVERIFEIDNPTPYFSAPGCRLQIQDRTHLTASCTAPSTLMRLELAMRGWRARISGAPAKVTTVNEIFQAVALPSGDSVVSFAFLPPFMPYGYVACVAGLAILAAGLWRRPDTRVKATETPSGRRLRHDHISV